MMKIFIKLQRWKGKILKQRLFMSQLRPPLTLYIPVTREIHAGFVQETVANRLFNKDALQTPCPLWEMFTEETRDRGRWCENKSCSDSVMTIRDSLYDSRERGPLFCLLNVKPLPHILRQYRVSPLISNNCPFPNLYLLTIHFQFSVW
jgi:hypothetical protein